MEDPSWVIDTAGELQSSIPVVTQMRGQGGIVTTVSTFVGISKDKGKNWVFIDCGQTDYATMRKKCPDLKLQFLNVRLQAAPLSRLTKVIPGILLSGFL